jgi:hypothetical protein
MASCVIKLDDLTTITYHERMATSKCIIFLGYIFSKLVVSNNFEAMFMIKVDTALLLHKIVTIGKWKLVTLQGLPL